MRKSVSESASADANKKIFAKIDDGAVAWEVQRKHQGVECGRTQSPNEGNRIAQN
jgi:hypothetical protein